MWRLGHAASEPLIIGRTQCMGIREARGFLAIQTCEDGYDYTL